MTDIQRYQQSNIYDDIPHADGEWVKYKDHIKAMQEQAKEIERMDRAFREKIKRINSRHDAITFKQEKEIERLKQVSHDFIDEISEKSQEIEQLKETLYLISNKANAARLHNSFDAIDKGDVIEKELIE